MYKRQQSKCKTHHYIRPFDMKHIVSFKLKRPISSLPLSSFSAINTVACIMTRDFASDKCKEIERRGKEITMEMEESRFGWSEIIIRKKDDR